MECTCSISVGSPDECRMGATLMGASHAIPLFPAAQPLKHPINRLRVCDVANLLNKHRNSVTKWLNTGLRLEREDSEFKERLDYLDAVISPQF